MSVTSTIDPTRLAKLIETEERVRSPSGERLVLSKKVPLVSANGEVEGICGIRYCDKKRQPFLPDQRALRRPS